MKKNLISKAMVIMVSATLVASAFTGCGKKDKDSATKVFDYDIKDYVTELGAYTGRTVEEQVTEVTDEDVQNELNELRESKATYNDITDRAVIEGDILTIDYTKSQAGADDVNQTDFEVTVGEGTLGNEIEAKLVGMELNKTSTVEVDEATTSDDGSTSTVKSTYTITVKSIKEKVLPEVTSEFLNENTEYDSLDNYLAGTKLQLEEDNLESAKQQAKSQLLQDITKDSTVVGAPAFLYNINYNSLAQTYSNYANYFGTDLEGYLEMAGSSLEGLQEQAVSTTEQALVVEAILKDAGKDITDEQYNEKLKSYVDEYDYKSTDELLEKFSKEELLMSMRSEVCLDYLYENNTINQTTVSASSN